MASTGFPRSFYFWLFTFSSDFIIGYPGENDQDFSETLELIKKIKFINSYSFIYSPRPGTVAASLKNIDQNSILLMKFHLL